MDDWREETQLRLKKSKIYETLVIKCNNEPAGMHVISLVDEAVYYSYQRTKLILRHMGEFTLHDGEHLFRVLKIMEILLTDRVINQLSIPELMLLILLAFYHDIGMAPNESEIKAWKKLWEGELPSAWEKDQYEKFNRFCEARPDRFDEYKKLLKDGEDSKAQLVLSYLISEYIRITHADRAKVIINDDWNGKIRYRDVDLTVEFAQLCASHCNDPLDLFELDQSLLCGPETFVCLPFIGVILRLSDILDFDAKRTPSVLFSHLTVRNPVSISEWKKHISIEAWNFSTKRISFQAKCEHPAIESTIHKFCDIIDKELIACNNIISNLGDDSREHFPEFYKIIFPPRVDRTRIRPKSSVFGKPLYKYRDTFFNLNKQQVIDLLMGTKLYGDPSVALRELLQNSIDACLLRQSMEGVWGNKYEPKIKVELIVEKSAEYLIVEDNGIGMDEEIIEKYYSQIGSSFYKSADFYNLRAKYNVEFTPTSRFGIGILSCFMVSDTLEVNTRRLYGPHDSSEPIQVIVEGHESIFYIKDGSKSQPGTITKLFLRKNHPWQRITEDKLIEYVEKTIPNPPFKIDISTPSKKEIYTNAKFIEQSTKSLKDYTWQEDENIREIEFKLKDTQNGISGICCVGILEKRDKPVKKIEILSKEVIIDGQTYNLSLEKYISNNSIKKRSDSIEVNDDEGINVNSSSSSLCESKSRISMHGIEIPTSLFPPLWASENLPRLNWAFPSIIIVDIGGPCDLDLNSSRTNIMLNEKWLKFEENLSLLICKGIHENVLEEYWEELKRILLSETQSNTFKEVLRNM